jgi:hypothetical protein
MKTIYVRRPTKFFGLLFALLCFVTVAYAPKAHAAYDQSRLIDDDVFLNSATMDPGTIQNFLVSKGSGLASSSFLFDCPAAGATANNAYIQAGAPCGRTVLASTIIYYAAQIYGLNPQAILATMQKEQSLVTTPNPTSWQINEAMGYACPDSGGCGASSFFYQIDNGTWDLRFHMERARGNMTWWYTSTSWVCGTAKNYYSPNLYPSQNVNFIDDDNVLYRTLWMTNAASSSLYCYTPHAYNNPQGLYGLPPFGTVGRYYTGSYNFVAYFESWFGSTKSGMPLPVSSVSLNTTEATVGQPVTATYTVKNPFSYAITVPSIGISNRLGGTQMYDFGIQNNITFAAGETKTFTATFTPNTSGPFRMQAVYNIYQGWYGGNYSWLNTHFPSLEVTSKPSVSPEFPLINTSPTISFSIKNVGGLTAYLTNLMAADMDGTTSRGYAATTITIAPGQSYTYSASRTADSTRQQTAWIAYQLGSGWYRLGDNISFRAYNTPADLELTAPISTDPTYPVINTTTTATFKVKNMGDQPVRVTNLGLGVTRVSDNQRFDFSSQVNGLPGVIAGGQEYIFKASRSFPIKDTYNFFLTGSFDGTNFSNIVNSASLPTSANVQTYNSPANITFTDPIHAQQSSGPLSHIVDLSYTIKNTGDAPTGNITIAFYCRQNNTLYCDIGGRTVNLSSGDSATQSSSLAYFSPGILTFRALRFDHGVWQDYGQSAQVNILNQAPASSTFTTSLSLDHTTITRGTTVTATYTIKNNSSSDLQLPEYAVAARLNGAFYDFGLQYWFYLRAGETKTFTAQITPTSPGTYSLFPVLHTANDSWYGYTQQQLVVQ